MEKHDETEEWAVCAHCGQIIEPGDENIFYNNNTDDRVYICPECYDDGYRACYECGEVHRWMSAHPEDCDEYICEACYDDMFVRCDRCGDDIRHDDAYWDSGEEAYFCRDCYDEYTRSRVRGYHNSPVRYSHYTTDPDAIYYGVELEMGNTDSRSCSEASVQIDENFHDIFHMEHDCSIREHGFETISIPLTWEVWQEKHRMMNRLYDIFSNYGLENDDSCGYHIHVSRGALTSLQWKGISWFLYKHQAVWEEIAQREEVRQFCKYAPDGFYEGDSYGRFDELTDSWDRYRAVNMCNSRTIEFRIFASVDTSRQFYRALDIVHFLVEWVKSNPTTLFCMIETPHKAFRRFIEYVRANETADMKYADYLERTYNYYNS